VFPPFCVSVLAADARVGVGAAEDVWSECVILLLRPQAEARSRAQEEEEAALAAASVKRAPGPGALSRPVSAKPSAAAAAPAAPPCKTCGCTEFTPHPFKVGMCTKCFHAH
jgi:hypothetical protein